MRILSVRSEGVRGQFAKLDKHRTPASAPRGQDMAHSNLL